MPKVTVATNQGDVIEVIDVASEDIEQPLRLADFIDRVRWAIRAALARE